MRIWYIQLESIIHESLNWFISVVTECSSPSLSLERSVTLVHSYFFAFFSKSSFSFPAVLPMTFLYVVITRELAFFFCFGVTTVFRSLQHGSSLFVTRIDRHVQTFKFHPKSWSCFFIYDIVQGFILEVESYKTHCYLFHIFPFSVIRHCMFLWLPMKSFYQSLLYREFFNSFTLHCHNLKLVFPFNNLMSYLMLEPFLFITLLFFYSPFTKPVKFLIFLPLRRSCPQEHAREYGLQHRVWMALEISIECGPSIWSTLIADRRWHLWNCKNINFHS